MILILATYLHRGAIAQRSCCHAILVMDFEQLHEKIDDEDKTIILLCSLPPTFLLAFGQDLNLPQGVHQKW
jgi:hypothetical protein